MKTTLLITLSIVLFALKINAQSDGCSLATILNETPTCATPTNGTTTGATQTIAGCTGTADDDVWYQFIATSTSHQIIVTPSAGMDPVVQLFSGGCGTLVSLVCRDANLGGGIETINYSGLTIGSTYRARIYNYGIGSGTGDFTICLTTPPPPPINNLCGSPTPLSLNATCSFVTATTDGASQSYPGCAGNADDDVWFSFIATNSLANVLVHPIDNLDLVFQVYDGTCGSLTSLACVDNTLTSQDEQSDIVGLIPGVTYLIRVFDYYDGSTGDFQICVTGSPSPVPTNDEPCNAIQLPAITASCAYSQFTTVGASASLTPPTPSSCVGGSGVAIGGFSSTSLDVWFSITVPASGNVDIASQPHGAAGSISDGVMALYSGSCSTLIQIACSDDHDYPGTSNDLLPLISESGLTPGATVYLRYWGYGSTQGTFGICVSTTSNDDCVNALYICDINGYSSSTSASYTADRPDNMFANNETSAGVNLPDGTDSGGPFGSSGLWGTGSPFIDVIINNNSWIKFTASATTATLTVNIFDCWIGNYPQGGIQMQIFEANNCTNFLPVSNFEESSTGFVITANALTIGNDYYLMVDGYAGDICNYTILADSGVQFPEITPVSAICIGNSVTLSAPPGASSYIWSHSGEVTQSVTVTPATTQIYTCEVTGLCDYKQTLNTTVVVNQLPNVLITNGATAAICDGENINLNASGATTYSWSPFASGATISVAPTSLTNYTVTGTDTNGCSNTDVITVSVNALPTLSINPTAVESDCGGSNGALNGIAISGTPSYTYSWSNGTSIVGTTSNITGIPAGSYTLLVTDGNSCNAMFGPFNVINPGAPNAPNITIDDSNPCLNSSILLNVTGDPGATFSWTGPNSFSSTNSSVPITNLTNLESGNYCVSQSVAGCTGPSACQLVTVAPLPTVDIFAANNDSTICLNQDITLTASGASTYSWSGPNAFTGTDSTETILIASILNDGIYDVIGTDASGCQNTATITITILPVPNISILADHSTNTYCNGFSAVLTASGASSYSWTGPNSFSEIGTSVNVLALDANSQGYYYVQGTDIEGCINNDSILITVVTDVPAQSPSDTSLCPGSKWILYGSGGGSYVWSGPDGFYSQDQNPVISNNLTGINEGWYSLTIIDANGCLGYDSTFLDISHNAGCLFIPNLVTPNFDNNNDAWIIEGLDQILDAEVSIFNRWGNLIYYSSPYNNDWSGEVNKGAQIDGGDGKVPAGTYFYIINLNNGDDTGIFKGYLEVEY